MVVRGYGIPAHGARHVTIDPIGNLKLNATPDDQVASGIISVGTVGENVDAGEICYLKADGKYWLADADSAAEMPAVVLAIDDILADASGLLLHMGFYRDDTLYNWTVGNGEANNLFVHTTPGAMVQLANQPAGSGDQVQFVGYVTHADRIFFNPSGVLVEIT